MSVGTCLKFYSRLQNLLQLLVDELWLDAQGRIAVWLGLNVAVCAWTSSPDACEHNSLRQRTQNGVELISLLSNQDGLLYHHFERILGVADQNLKDDNEDREENEVGVDDIDTLFKVDVALQEDVEHDDCKCDSLASLGLAHEQRDYE